MVVICFIHLTQCFLHICNLSENTGDFSFFFWYCTEVFTLFHLFCIQKYIGIFCLTSVCVCVCVCVCVLCVCVRARARAHAHVCTSVCVTNLSLPQMNTRISSYLGLTCMHACTHTHTPTQRNEFNLSTCLYFPLSKIHTHTYKDTYIFSNLNFISICISLITFRTIHTFKPINDPSLTWTTVTQLPSY